MSEIADLIKVMQEQMQRQEERQHQQEEAPNSAKFRGGCRFDKEGVTKFLKFLLDKNINFLEFLR